MTFESFKGLIDLWKQAQEKSDSISNAVEKLFDEDTTIALYWPANMIKKAIVLALADTDMNEETVEWFLYDGLSQIEHGGTEIGVKGEGEVYTYYTIKSLEDYFNFEIKQDYSNLEISQKPKFESTKAYQEGFGHYQESILGEIFRAN